MLTDGCFISSIGTEVFVAESESLITAVFLHNGTDVSHDIAVHLCSANVGQLDTNKLLDLSIPAQTTIRLRELEKLVFSQGESVVMIADHEDVVNCVVNFVTL